jgi:hypothetical protein
MGLGATVDPALDMGAVGLPDEPLRDPWTFDPPSGGVYVLMTGAGAAALAGAALAFKNWTR